MLRGSGSGSNWRPTGSPVADTGRPGEAFAGAVFKPAALGRADSTVASCASTLDAFVLAPVCSARGDSTAGATATTFGIGRRDTSPANALRSASPGTAVYAGSPRF